MVLLYKMAHFGAEWKFKGNENSLGVSFTFRSGLAKLSSGMVLQNNPQRVFWTLGVVLWKHL